MHTSRRLLTAAVLAGLVVCVLVAGGAAAGRAKPVSAPTDLHGFLLRPDEPRTEEFSRTPAFAWDPVPGALCYEFELATAGNFTENSIIWSNVHYGLESDSSTVCGNTAEAASGSTTTAPTAPTTASADVNPATSPIAPFSVPAASIDLALPWFTGQPYALHAHVRAIGLAGAGAWSDPWSFNTRWPSVPTPMPLPTQGGLIRWTPIEGATGYEVWYTDLSARFATHTNVADLREFYTFGAVDWSTVHWRVRAERRIFGDIPNGLPAVSHGPWSPVYTTVNPPTLSTGPLTITMGISDRVSTLKRPTSHQLMPALVYTGDEGLDGSSYSLFRVYGFTDRDCVNPVYTGPVIGGPTYAPRRVGLIKLPASADEYRSNSLEYGTDQGATTNGADGFKVVSNEVSATVAAAPAEGAGDDGVQSDARVDLPDVDFPSTPYYFTVVPVRITAKDAAATIANGPPGTAATPSDSGASDPSVKPEKWVYRDVDLPQDACAAGRILALGKKSDPVLTSKGGPNIAGLTPDGKLLSPTQSTPSVYSTPLVSWRPAIGATAYEIQWSPTRYPWKAVGLLQTYATSAILHLAPGTWFYRVRGLNQAQKRKPEMAWSRPLSVRVVSRTFRLVASNASSDAGKAPAATSKTDATGAATGAPPSGRSSTTVAK